MRLHVQYSRVTPAVRRAVIGAAAEGLTYREIIDRVGVSMGTVTNVTRPFGGLYRRQLWAEPSPHRLGLEDRIMIWHLLRDDRGDAQGKSARRSYAQIGAALEHRRDKSTICREVNGNGGREGYRPVKAQQRADARRCRDKPTKLAANPQLRDVVAEKLEALWSPEQIAAHLKQTHPDNDRMRVSHETIYKSLYVQGRGELRRELAACLRTGRAKRRPRGGRPQGASIHNMVNISQRPAEAQDRAVPGHWEGDLIIGENGDSAVGTLVERSSRFVLLLHLPNGRTAAAVREAMTAKIITLPQAIQRSLTWDQGVEMAQHAQFTLATGIPVYFCDPHAPWQRGSNENTNGLLRQYMPKGTDLSIHTKADLNTIADSLNTRPRKTLGWNTPAQVLAHIVATTP